jgi:DNA-binding HxlR family transcriptional regulator
MKGTLRKIKLNISDLEQTNTRLDQRIKELEDLGIIQKAIAKEAEDK